MNTLKLEDLEIYQLANEIGEYVWNLVSGWEHFAKRTSGEQFVDAADSISANIAEGYGRYHFKERKTLCYYSRGSLMETKAWAFKCSKRLLIAETEYTMLIDKLQLLHYKLNGYIKKLKAIPPPAQ